MPYLDTIIVDLLNDMASLHWAKGDPVVIDLYRHELDYLIQKKNTYDYQTAIQQYARY